MSNLVAAPTIAKNLETVLLRGDLSVLDAHDKIAYYKSVCESVGLNPLTKPFEYIKLNGKEVLYATRACTDQLRFIHKISLEIAARDKFDSLYVVTARARNPDGRVDESTGAVDLSNLKGDALANAMMKAETKAKRRVTLSICGLALLDETEVASIAEVVETPPQIASIPVKHSSGSINEPRFDLDPPKIATYTISFGKHKGKRFIDMDAYELDSYCKYIKKGIAETKSPKQMYVEFVDLAEEYLSGLEPSKKQEFDMNEEIPL